MAVVSQSGNVAVNALAARRGLRLHTVVSCGNQAVVDAGDWLARHRPARGRALGRALPGERRRRRAPVRGARAVRRRRHRRRGAQGRGLGRRGERGRGAHRRGGRRPRRLPRAGAGGRRAPGRTTCTTCSSWPRRSRSAARARAATAGWPSSPARAATRASEPTRPSASASSCPPCAPDTAERVRALLPAAATVANPLDYTAIIWGEVETLRDMIAAVGEDPGIDHVLAFYDQPQGLEGAVRESWDAVREGIRAGAQASPVPTLVASTLPELLDDEAAWELAGADVAAVAGLRTALACAAALRRPPGDAARLRADRRGRGARARRAPGPWLDEASAKALLAGAGIRVPPGRVARDEDDAAEIFARLGRPVALKLVAAGLRHKTEAGAVALGLEDERNVRWAYRDLVRGNRTSHPLTTARVLVEAMAPGRGRAAGQRAPRRRRARPHRRPGRRLDRGLRRRRRHPAARRRRARRARAALAARRAAAGRHAHRRAGRRRGRRRARRARGGAAARPGPRADRAQPRARQRPRRRRGRRARTRACAPEQEPRRP